MASKMSPRRSAAEAMLEKMGGMPGGGDEEMAPEPDAGPSPMPEEGAPPMPEDAQMAPPEGDQGMDLDSALAGVESAVQGLPEDAAKEIRTHLEAIRDIASGGGGGMPESEGLPPAAEATAPPEAPDSGLEKMPL